MRIRLKDLSIYFISLVFIFNCSFVTSHAHRKRSSQHKDGFLDFHFVEEPQNLVIGKQAAIFNCSFEVRQGVQIESIIEWHKDGQNVDGLKITNNSLVIDKPNKSNEGVYQCVVRVKHNSIEWIYLSRKAKLVLPKLGNFASQPISQKIFEKQFVAFRCALDAETNSQFANLFQFEWLHNNQKINNDSERINILPLTNTLEISNAQKSDSGNYSCVVRNNDQTSITSQTAFLDVLEGSVTNGAISFALQPKFQTVKENSRILLECLSNGSPKPLITWLHNGQPIDEKLKKYQRIGVDHSSLLIESVQASDAGLYSCKAETTDDITDAAANIVVQSVPQILKAPKSLKIQETMDVEFECVVKGGAQISWYKNGESIKPSEYFVVNGNRLKIYGLIRDDQGVYQCFIDGDESAQASAQLQVYEAALTQALISDGSTNEIREPLDLHAQSIGARSIRLKWDQPIGLSPTSKISYSVFYRFENATSENIANSSTPSLTLTDLNPNTSYSIRVQAIDSNNKSGKSSASIVLKTKTEEVEIGQVRNLRVQVLSADSAVVDWDSPILSTPRSLRYKFFYKRVNTAKEEEEIQSVVVKTSYSLHSLRKNSEYSVRVQVVDGANAGPSSPSIQFHTYSDVPEGPPTNIKLDAPDFGVLRIRWSPPAIDQQNGNLTSYKIRYKTKGRSSKSLIAMANADVNEHKITGLDTGLMYQVRIAAQNQNGTGPFSEWITIELPAEDQGDEISPAPSELKVFAGYDSIHVSWLPPREHNVMIQGYSIGWGVYVPDREKANVGPDEREYTINGLKPNRDYVISVRAITRAGDGFPIYETVKTTSYAQPAVNPTNSDENANQFAKSSSSLVPPIGVQAESISSSSIRVSWSDPNNLFNQFYSVRYSPSGNTEQQIWRYVNTTENEALIDGLQPNTQYEFSVRLVESQLWSMAALTKTQSAPPSSAPRDLSVVPAFEREDPNSVMVSWQQPKYSNGDIEEYVIFYSDRLDLPDRDWILESAKGDRLSIKISGLSPKSTYYFKIQARNSKGYGPLSPVVTFVPGRLGYNNPSDVYNHASNTENPKRSNSELLELIIEAARQNLLYIVIGTAVLVFIIVLLIICLCRRGDSAEKIRRHNGYVAGRKLSSVNRDNGPDCWIAHSSNRVELLSNPPINANHELKQFANCAVDSPPPRYQTHHANGVANGTIPRNYHHSTVSLETRQKTPQILYTGTNRQHINKIDLSSDRGSSFGGSNTILQMSSTPPLIAEAGYQTVRQANNPLRSFVQMNVPPPIERIPSSQSPINQPEPRMASVRPVVVASPHNVRASNAQIRPAGIVIGQRSTANGLAPVGLAHAQPRVNVASIYSPYQSTLGSKEDVRTQNTDELDHCKDIDRPISSASNEIVNPQQFDSMINTLQALQQQFEN